MIKLMDLLTEVKCNDSAGIIVQSEMGIVLCKEDKWWGIPKGRVDHGETPLEAAVRETIEETSILITAKGGHINTPVVSVAEKKNDKGGDFYIFKTTLKMPIIPVKSHEHEEVRYFDSLPEDTDPRLEGLI